MSGLEVVVALVILVGIVGVVVPVLPGSILVIGAILVWALELRTTTGWVVLGVAGAFVAIGAVVKYVVPGRRLKDAGIPSFTLILGAVLGVIGFFVVPIVGLFLGFVLGVFLSELQRVGRTNAWPATVHALKAVGLAMLIEFIASLLAASTWLAGVIAT